MNYLSLAFFMGLFGSIHCAAMCGPLIVAVQQSAKPAIWNKIIYQLGRILTYSTIGLLMGIIGNVGFLKNGQQNLSILTGVLLLAIAIFQFSGRYSSKLARWQSVFMQPVARFLGKWMFRPGGSFVAGILNGLLPCAMVYMALAASLNADGLINSILFMFLFGLGTLPLLLILSFVGGWSKKIFKKGFSRTLPYLYLFMGIWFILRGAQLDIPYLSPLLHLDGAMNCM